MATLLSESLFMNDDKEFEVSEINGAFLMSLLEESQGEENDDERLTTIMRSLEAEINPDVSVDGSDSGVASEMLDIDYYEDDIQLFSSEDMDGEVCFQDLDNNHNFRWVGEEIVPSSPSDDMNWCIEGNEMDDIIEFEGFRDYEQIICYRTALEDQGYGSLWQ